MSRRPAEVAIVARSLVSSLGHDVVTACAAARAGITRPSELPTYPVSTSSSALGEGLTVHAVPWLTRGFEGRMRLVRLVEGALRDLRAQAPDVSWPTASTGVFVSLPDPARTLTGIALVSESAARERLAQRAQSAELRPPHDVATAVIGSALELCRLDAWLPVLGCAMSGSPGVAEVIALAIDSLLQERVEYALVIAADTFLDEETLSWLDTAERLKTPTRPAGLPPGEAAGCLLLQRAERARACGTRVWALLERPTLTSEEDCLLEGRYSRGHALAEAISYADRPHEQATPWLVTDLDGEGYRAMEWGNAWLHLGARMASYRGLTLWTPAEFFGATGAAAGLVGTCVALAAFARGYAPRASAVVVNASDGPCRSAMRVRSAGSASPGPVP
jgi:3-oxoacyl-[acyl-carrier-protein] synthase-1